MPDYGGYTAPAAGVTTTRTGALFGKVQFILGSANQANLKLVINNVPAALVYEFLDRGQHQLATELLCLEKSASVTFTSGVGPEPSGFFRLKQIELPTTQTWQPTEVTPEQYDDLLRGYFSGGQTPSWYKRWGGNIYLYPVPSTGAFTVYYHGIPTTTIAQATDPETPSYMDEALLYYAVKELAPVVGRNDLLTIYTGLYAKERDRVIGLQRKTKTVLLEIEAGPYL